MYGRSALDRKHLPFVGTRMAESFRDFAVDCGTLMCKCGFDYVVTIGRHHLERECARRVRDSLGVEVYEANCAAFRGVL
jgi:hypothetical protein